MLRNIISVSILAQDRLDGLSLTLTARSVISKESQHGAVDYSLLHFLHQRRAYIVGNGVVTLVASGVYLFYKSCLHLRLKLLILISLYA